MRLSLLLQREPFGKILERTMSAYWAGVLRRPVEVRWGDADRRRQVWRGNVYLNFFAVDGTDASCFEILVREFGHARAAWRRPLQRAYVETAVRMPWRRWLSQVRFDVGPDVPLAAEQVLVGGNRRLRLIVPHSGRCIVVHKHSFDPRGIHREVAARRGAAAAVSPRMLQVANDGLSFEEEYIEGTPINRLGGPAEQSRRSEAVQLLTEFVHGPSARVSSVADLAVLAAGALQACTESQLVSVPNSVRTELMDRVRAIHAAAENVAGTAAVPEVLSHGDFQEANVLSVGGRIFIIDWENADRRSAFYDLATIHSGLRLSPDWVSTWESVRTGWQDMARPPFPLWSGADWSPAMRHGLSLLWALEESAFRAEDALMSAHADTTAAWSSLARDLGRVMKCHGVLAR